MPGRAHADASGLLRSSAAAHRRLLVRAKAEGRGAAGRAFAQLLSAVDALPSRSLQERFLLDPSFVESLHAATRDSLSLAAWHCCVAEPSIATVWPMTTKLHRQRLSNSILPLLLRDDPNWCGRLALRTDLTGRLRFPLSDWSISFSGTGGSPRTVVADETVAAFFRRNDVRLSLGADAERELIVVPRSTWLRMFVDNDGSLDGRRIAHRSCDVRVQLHYATAIPRSNVRFDPVAMDERGDHAAWTGGLVAEVLHAIAHHSPWVGVEFSAVMSSVRGWELPSSEYGTIQSFSDPTLPRVMAINVPYTAQGDPCVSPLCFTWFGHELAHTKSYLIETVLHGRGLSAIGNGGGYTDVIPRYGRRLPLRTLMQIPYTHLYEWVLLMDALEADFAALPWTVSEDPMLFGDAIQEEIEEAFDRIRRDVKPTPCGRAILGRLRSLSDKMSSRWAKLRPSAAAR